MSYLMKKLGMTFKEALDYVRKKRWVVNPNPGFVRQLKRYEMKLKGTNNPESPEKMESRMSKTLKPQLKKEVSTKSSESSMLARPNLFRGKSIQ